MKQIEKGRVAWVAQAEDYVTTEEINALAASWLLQRELLEEVAMLSCAAKFPGYVFCGEKVGLCLPCRCRLALGDGEGGVR